MLDDLYQDLILQNADAPRNYGSLEHADQEVELYNPVCGDRVVLTAAFEEEQVADLRFAGEGCSISRAAASIMTELVKGKTKLECRTLAENFARFLRGDAVDEDKIGDLVAFAGVRHFPVRSKCAFLVFDALLQLLSKQDATTDEKNRT